MATDDNLATADPKTRSGNSLRRAALAVVAILSVGLCATLSLRVLFTTLWSGVDPSPRECSESVEVLYVAVERAKTRADLQISGEHDALQAFREALLPEWSEFEAIRKKCASTPNKKAQFALRQVELLRFAEERAVRYEALDLSRLRRAAPAAVKATRPSTLSEKTP